MTLTQPISIRFSPYQKKFLHSGSSKMYGMMRVRRRALFSTPICSFCVRHEESAASTSFSTACWGNRLSRQQMVLFECPKH